MPRPFAVIGFTVFFTIALLFNFDTGVTVTALAVFSVALVISVLIKSVRVERTIPCSLASAVIACILLLSTVQFLYLPAISYDGKTCNITATLSSEPEYEYGNCYYIGKINSIDSEPVDIKARIVLSPSSDVDVYDEIKGNFRFYIPGKTNDISLSSNISNGIFIGVYPDDDFEIIDVPESEKPFMYKIIKIRTHIKNTIYRLLPDETGALAIALLIGDKSGLSSQTLNNFNFIGISHIICVSGYHLTLWSSLIFEILRKTGLNLRISSFICIFPVLFFMLLSGMTYSVFRSGIMMLLYLIANIFIRKSDSLNTLGLALVLIAVFNPLAMGSASLQLSTLATAGILLYSQSFADKFEKCFEKINNHILRRTVRYFVAIFMVTLSANAFTLPVSLSISNLFNFIAFLANIIAVPISGLCMVLCAIGTLIGFVSTLMINIPIYFCGILSRFLIFISDELSQLRNFYFKIEPDETAIIIISVFLICIISLLFAYFGKKTVKLTFALCSFVFVLLIVIFSATEKTFTKLQVVDCGNGMSVVLSKGDETIVLGCGGTQFNGAYNLCYAIEETGNNPDILVFPDSDRKSSEYFFNVLTSFNPTKIYCNNYPNAYKPLMKNIEIGTFSDKIESGYFDIECQIINNNPILKIKNEDTSVLILFDPITDIDIIPEQFRNTDIIISRNDYPVGIEKTDSDIVVINAENNRGFLLQNELKNRSVNYAVTAGCGNIILKADDGYVSVYRN